MSSKTIAIVLVVVGILIVLVSALADSLGLGAHAASFGTRQIIGLVVGIIIVVVGGGLYWRSIRST